MRVCVRSNNVQQWWWGGGDVCNSDKRDMCNTIVCCMLVFFPPFVCVFVPWRYYAILFFTCQMGLEMEIRRVVIISPYLHVNAHQ